MLFESSPRGQQTDDSDEEPVSELELSAGNKDTFVLEVTDHIHNYAFKINLIASVLYSVYSLT